jgi:hypothetical protein
MPLNKVCLYHLNFIADFALLSVRGKGSGCPGILKFLERFEDF